MTLLWKSMVSIFHLHKNFQLYLHLLTLKVMNSNSYNHVNSHTHGPPCPWVPRHNDPHYFPHHKYLQHPLKLTPFLPFLHKTSQDHPRLHTEHTPSISTGPVPDRQRFLGPGRPSLDQGTRIQLVQPVHQPLLRPHTNLNKSLLLHLSNTNLHQPSHTPPLQQPLTPPLLTHPHLPPCQRQAPHRTLQQ